MKTDALRLALTDEDLASRRALAELYERYARRLVPFLAGRGIAVADLDDVHHEVWLRVARSLEGRPFQGHFRGFLFEVARNLASDHLRKRRPQPLDSDAPLTARGPSPAAAVLHDEEQRVLRRCLERLGAEEAAVIRGRLGGLDYAEISVETGVTADRAYKLFFVAKAKLTTCVERSGS